MAKKSTSSNKKRLVKVEAVGQAHVHSSFNNIIISLTNSTGQVILINIYAEPLEMLLHSYIPTDYHASQPNL